MERQNPGKAGRRERIRTSGPYVPNVVLYQAELLSDKPNGLSWPVSRERPYSDALWGPQPAKITGFLGGSRRFFGIFAALKGVGPLYMVPARTTALGRRQVVRHWILIPAFEGSIPSAPATRGVMRVWRTLRGGIHCFRRSTGPAHPLRGAQLTPAYPGAMPTPALTSPEECPWIPSCRCSVF